MGLINVGRILRQHGVKGGMKVTSDFKYKKDVFKKGNVITVNGKNYTITSYTYAGGGQADILYLDGINTIDDVIRIRQNDIYIDKAILNIDEILDQELIDMDVYLNDELLGKVIDVNSGINPLIILNYNNKKIYIPRQDTFIESIDVENNKIIVNDSVGGLL